MSKSDDGNSSGSSGCLQRFHSLSAQQIKVLDQVLSEIVPIHGRGNFPTLELRPRDIIASVRSQLQARGISVRDVRLNGSTASHVLIQDNGTCYKDLDIIFGVDLPRQEDFMVIKEVVLGCLLDFLPPGVNRERISSATLKEAYVQKMVKVFSDQDRWSLISLSNNSGKNLELKFVSVLRRQFEFSVDSFQIILDSMLDAYLREEGRTHKASDKAENIASPNHNTEYLPEAPAYSVADTERVKSYDNHLTDKTEHLGQTEHSNQTVRLVQTEHSNPTEHSDQTEPSDQMQSLGENESKLSEIQCPLQPAGPDTNCMMEHIHFTDFNDTKIHMEVEKMCGRLTVMSSPKQTLSSVTRKLSQGDTSSEDVSEGVSEDTSSETKQITEIVAKSNPFTNIEAETHPVTELEAKTQPIRTETDPIQLKDPVHFKEPVHSKDSIHHRDPVHSKELVHIKESVHSKEPVHIKESVHSKESVHLKEPVNFNKSVHLNNPAHLKGPVHPKDTVQLKDPVKSSIASESSSRRSVMVVLKHLSPKVPRRMRRKVSPAPSMAPKPSTNLSSSPTPFGPRPFSSDMDFTESATVLHPTLPQSTVTQVDLLNPTTTQSAVTQVELLNPTTTQSAVTQVQLLNPTTTQSAITQVQLLNPTTTQSAITQVQLLNITTTQEELLNSTPTQSVVTQVELLNTTPTQSAVTQVELLNPTTTQSAVNQVELLNPYPTQSEIIQVKLLNMTPTQSPITQVEMLNTTPTQSAITQVELLNTTPTHSPVTQVELLNPTPTLSPVTQFLKTVPPSCSLYIFSEPPDSKPTSQTLSPTLCLSVSPRNSFSTQIYDLSPPSSNLSPPSSDHSPPSSNLSHPSSDLSPLYHQCFTTPPNSLTTFNCLSHTPFNPSPPISVSPPPISLSPPPIDLSSPPISLSPLPISLSPPPISISPPISVSPPPIFLSPPISLSLHPISLSPPSLLSPTPFFITIPIQDLPSVDSETLRHSERAISEKISEHMSDREILAQTSEHIPEQISLCPFEYSENEQFRPSRLIHLVPQIYPSQEPDSQQYPLQELKSQPEPVQEIEGKPEPIQVPDSQPEPLPDPGSRSELGMTTMEIPPSSQLLEPLILKHSLRNPSLDSVSLSPPFPILESSNNLPWNLPELVGSLPEEIAKDLSKHCEDFKVCSLVLEWKETTESTYTKFLPESMYRVFEASISVPKANKVTETFNKKKISRWLSRGVLTESMMPVGVDFKVPAIEVSSQIPGDPKMPAIEVSSQIPGDPKVPAIEVSSQIPGDPKVPAIEVSSQIPGDKKVPAIEVSSQIPGDIKVPAIEVSSQIPGDPKVPAIEVSSQIPGDPKVPAIEVSSQIPGDKKVPAIEVSSQIPGDPKIPAIEVSSQIPEDPKVPAIAVSSQFPRDPKLPGLEGYSKLSEDPKDTFVKNRLPEVEMPSQSPTPAIEVLAESMYGDFQEAMEHLRYRLIATRNPEEIRGGGLLKYSNLLVRDYQPACHTQIKNLERYMCSRFFIDFPGIMEQRRKIQSYLRNHFIGEERTKYQYLMTLRRVVNDSTVCLMGHERRQTLNMITVLALRILGEQNVIPNTDHVTCYYQPAPYMTDHSAPYMAEHSYCSYYLPQGSSSLLNQPYPLHTQTGLV